MIAAVGQWVERWESLRVHPRYRTVGLLGAATLFAGLLWVPAPEGLTVPAQRAAALLAAMAWLWIGGVIPLAVTALLPLVFVPLLGLGKMNTTAAAYFDPLNILMLGGFILGHAMESVGLHRRLTAWLLAPAWVRASPRRVLFALMAATAALSALMSNTATMLMMLPLALTTAALSSSNTKVRLAFPLGCAYAASIGGLATLIGTPPNAVLAAQAPVLIGREVSFAGWMAIGVPFVVLAIPAAWWAVVATRRVPDVAEHPIAAPEVLPWSAAERSVVGVVALALIAWITRLPIDLGPVTVPGWAARVGPVDDAWVAMVAAVVLFLLPREPGRGGEPIVVWSRVERAIPWGVLLLLGGGFALAGAIEKSGLTDWLAQAGPWLARWPLPVATFAICASMVALTEFTSNAAAAQISIPLFAAAAQGAGVDPMVWLVPCTFAVSCGFMMPAGTGPNAIASEAGGVRPGDMAYAGLLVNVACAVLATAVSLVGVPWVFAAG